MPTKQDCKNGEHTSDNQGLCWWCGCVVNQDGWDDFVGIAVDTPADSDKLDSTLDRADANLISGQPDIDRP